MPIQSRVLVLGAGFGGLELTTILSGAFGDAIDILLIDRNDAFVFGFSKLDVMFGQRLPTNVRHPYLRHCLRLQFLQQPAKADRAAGSPEIGAATNCP
jgi:NADH dehydrogenase FAD-containing subunit